MQALKLICQHCPQNLDTLPKVGNEIGFGADGQCFSIVDLPDQVIKFSVLYDDFDLDIDNKYNTISKNLDFILKYNLEVYARVYAHGCLGKYSRQAEGWATGQDFILYFYIMEKLQKISEDECKVFHSILSHEDRGIVKNFSSEQIKKMLDGLARGLDFDRKKVMLFYNKIRTASISHLDLHVRNIMKDSAGNFKLIDLDRLELISK